MNLVCSLLCEQQPVSGSTRCVTASGVNTSAPRGSAAVHTCTQTVKHVHIVHNSPGQCNHNFQESKVGREASGRQHMLKVRHTQLKPHLLQDCWWLHCQPFLGVSGRPVVPLLSASHCSPTAVHAEPAWHCAAAAAHQAAVRTS